MTIIYRHRRENLKKCSLSGLEKRSDLTFLTYPTDPLPDLSHCLLLKVGAEPLTGKDQGKELLLIDGTWKLSEAIEKSLPWKLEARSLPSHFTTAYPRRQTGCQDPERGLSSLEALYIAHLILGKNTEGLLDNYYWKEDFLAKNLQIPL